MEKNNITGIPISKHDELLKKLKESDRFYKALKTAYEGQFYSIVNVKKDDDTLLYLLRNADTKAKGLGFALAGNFYPDFLLWLVDDEKGEQWLNFVDPKGLRRMSLNDPKLGLYEEVKVIQEKLADPKLTLATCMKCLYCFMDTFSKPAEYF